VKSISIRIAFFVIMMAFITIPAYVTALDKSSACIELSEKAEAFIQDKGKDYALKVFSASKGPFVEQDLYVFACSMNNKLLAHPYMKSMVGQDVSDFRDLKGRAVFQEFRKVADEKGSGWVDYWWKKPGENGEFSKTGYIKRIPEHNMYLVVGYYKPLQVGKQDNSRRAN
jgi:cytochrome c